MRRDYFRDMILVGWAMLTLGAIGCERSEGRGQAVYAEAQPVGAVGEPARANEPDTGDEPARADEPDTSDAPAAANKQASKRPRARRTGELRRVSVSAKPRLFYDNVTRGIKAVSTELSSASRLVVSDAIASAHLIDVDSGEFVGVFSSLYGRPTKLSHTRDFAQVRVRTMKRDEAVLDVASGEVFGVAEKEGFSLEFFLDRHGEAIWFIQMHRRQGLVEYGSIERRGDQTEVTRHAFVLDEYRDLASQHIFAKSGKALVLEMDEESECRRLELTLDGKQRCLLSGEEIGANESVTVISPQWMLKRHDSEGMNAAMVNFRTGEEFDFPDGCRPFIKATLSEPLRLTFYCNKGGDDMPQAGVWSPERTWFFPKSEFPRLYTTRGRIRDREPRFVVHGRARNSAVAYVIDQLQGRVMETPARLLGIDDDAAVALTIESEVALGPGRRVVSGTAKGELIGFDLLDGTPIDLGEVDCNGRLQIHDSRDGQFLLVCTQTDHDALRGKKFGCGFAANQARREHASVVWAEVVDVVMKTRYRLDARPIAILARDKILTVMDAACDHLPHLSKKIGLLELK